MIIPKPIPDPSMKKLFNTYKTLRTILFRKRILIGCPARHEIVSLIVRQLSFLNHPTRLKIHGTNHYRSGSLWSWPCCKMYRSPSHSAGLPHAPITLYPKSAPPIDTNRQWWKRAILYPIQSQIHAYYTPIQMESGDKSSNILSHLLLPLLWNIYFYSLILSVPWIKMNAGNVIN